jgi:DNA replication licensing factor MCM7
MQMQDPNVDIRAQFPVALLRRYDLYIKPLQNDKVLSVREVRADSIGHLVKVQGVVTRISEVSPKLIVNTYTCERCGNEIYQEINSSNFTPLTECQSEDCTVNNSKGKLLMQTRGSKFLKYQEAKIQEMADQVPVGHTPRTLTVHLSGEITRMINAGDVVVLSGVIMFNLSYSRCSCQNHILDFKLLKQVY